MQRKKREGHRKGQRQVQREGKEKCKERGEREILSDTVRQTGRRKYERFVRPCQVALPASPPSSPTDGDTNVAYLQDRHTHTIQTKHTHTLSQRAQPCRALHNAAYA